MKQWEQLRKKFTALGIITLCGDYLKIMIRNVKKCLIFVDAHLGTCFGGKSKVTSAADKKVHLWTKAFWVQTN